MSNDSYPGWVARVRKDPLGFGGLNRLVDNFRWSEQLFGTEHILSGGEHNAAEVPREVGSVYITAGPTGNKEGFRYATAATRSALGTIQLAIDSTKYSNAYQMALQATSMSESGVNKPCITSPNIISTSQIEFYSKVLTSALGAGNAWAAEDAHFCAAIHGVPLNRGGSAATPGLKLRGEYLTETSTDWNALVQSDQNMRSAFLAEHSAAGIHTNREVARTWAYATWNGAALSSTSSARNPVTTTTRVGIGHYQLTWRTAWALSAQPLVAVDYARNAGGAFGDIWVCCCPRSLVTTTTVDFFLYKYDTAAKTWARGDTDLFCVVHAG